MCTSLFVEYCHIAICAFVRMLKIFEVGLNYKITLTVKFSQFTVVAKEVIYPEISVTMFQNQVGEVGQVGHSMF